jgi:hypothetical protein
VDPNQTGVPPLPEECNQGEGRYVCPDGNPPYGCWAISIPRPSADDPSASDDPEKAFGRIESNARVVGICIDPPIKQPIPCEWLRSGGDDDQQVCALSLGGPAPYERGGVNAASDQTKPKAVKKHKAAKKLKAKGKKQKAAKKNKAAKKQKATKKPKASKR